MLSLAGVEAEAERPHGCPFKWAGLKFHHVQLLEMLHDSAPSGTSRQGGAAAPSLYSLPHIERQALEFAAVPGRLPQVGMQAALHPMLTADPAACICPCQTGHCYPD
jgi:hypothetical protein